MSPSTSTSPHLTATYTSATNAPFTISKPLASLPILPASASQAQSTAQKTAYLSALRQATAQMQEVINKELTGRMEEDNRRVAEGANGGGNGKVDEKMEEENYGEEVVDED